jgi:hypothetical protein
MESSIEYWEKIPYLDNYYASNLGRIKSIERYVRIGKNIKPVKEKILNPIKTKAGYLVVNITLPKRKQYLVHRLIALTFLGDSNLNVNHIDLDKSNNKVLNLEWVTQKENILHSILGGRNGQILLHKLTGIFYNTYEEAANAYNYNLSRFYKAMAKNNIPEFIKV